jgi:tRNA (cytosine38-C5)-methyltransferase
MNNVKLSRSLLFRNFLRDKMEGLCAIEFYSGLGGLSLGALEGSAGRIKVCVAFDIHPLANELHKFNIPETITSGKTIEQLTPKSLKNIVGKSTHLIPQVWLLSPPCQPFSRRGNQKDLTDPR